MKNRDFKAVSWGWAAAALILAVFYAFLLAQYSRVFIYYDDYGYLSLSYGHTVSAVAGTDFNLAQLWEFTWNHYFSGSSGRLLYMLFFQLLYMAGGLTWVQVFMATVMEAVLVLSFIVTVRQLRLDGRRELLTGIRPALLAAFLCVCYGMIGIMVQRLGSYWYAASFLYVVPAVAYFAFMLVYIRSLDGACKKGCRAASVCLALVASFSQEQWTAAVIASILTVWVYKYFFRKTFCRWDIAVLAGAAAGALPILTSPGAKARMARHTDFLAMSLPERVISNIRVVTRTFFSNDNQLYVCVFLLMLIVMTIYMILRGIGALPGNVLFLAATGAAGLYLFVAVQLEHLAPGQYPEPAVWLLFAYILWMSGQILYFLFQRGCLLQGFFYISAFISMACLVVVPEIPQRVLMPFIFLSWPLMGYILLTALGEKRLVAAGAALTACLAAVSVPNLRNIYRGYSANYAVHQYNDAMLRDASARIRNGEDIREVKLYKLIDPLCSNEMVYDPNVSFMIYWMDEYYDLPADVALDYRDVGSPEELALPAE
ncbi:MAG: DUF6056 family protein [Eubacteriales bacterium]|nr:DUF6056 family protein [Eubacteriales bacterium]